MVIYLIGNLVDFLAYIDVIKIKEDEFNKLKKKLKYMSITLLISDDYHRYDEKESN